MNQPSKPRRDWVPVAQTWQRNPDDGELWRQVTTMPALAFSLVEMELFGVVAGKRTCLLGIGDGTAALALAAMGARVTVVDPAQCYLDMLVVKTQLVGVELAYVQSEFCSLAGLSDGSFQLVCAAHVAPQVSDLGRFYAELHRILGPAGRLVVTEYHPVRRIWKQEPGHPRVRYSYFERCREREGGWQSDPATGAAGLERYDYQWTTADHFYYLTQAGFRVVALEEIGDVREHWEVPNLKGLPEQLILAADRDEGGQKTEV
ncbi:MAG: methyltransferase domain-containing protein [candidate division WOR-3 bacterium]